MAVRKTSKTTIIAFEPGDQQSLFYRAWRLMNLDGPLCPLPDPEHGGMSAAIERMRRQQVHIDEIKRLCHVRA